MPDAGWPRSRGAMLEIAAVGKGAREFPGRGEGLELQESHLSPPHIPIWPLSQLPAKGWQGPWRGVHPQSLSCLSSQKLILGMRKAYIYTATLA